MKGIISLFKTEGNDPYKHLVKVVLRNNLNRQRRRTIAECLEEDWDKRTRNFNFSYLNYDEDYVRVLDIRKKMMSQYFKGINTFDEAFDFLGLNNKAKVLSKNNNTDFYRYAEKKIDYYLKLQGDNSGSAKNYTYSIKKIKKYIPVLDFKDIKASLVRSLIDLMKLEKKKDGSRQLSNRTIKNILGDIQAIYNDMWVEYNLEDSNPFKNIKKELPFSKHKRTLNYIDYQSFLKLKNSKLENEFYQRAVDVILFQFYIGGQSLVDVFNLKKSFVIDQRIFTSRLKNADKDFEFDVKLFPCALEIIDKYQNKNSEYVFPWADKHTYNYFYKKTREHLSKVTELLNIQTLPKKLHLTTKTARHSFSTFSRQKEFDQNIVEYIMGHIPTKISTIHYGDVYKQETRDQIHFEIIDIEGNINNKYVRL